MIVKKAKNSSKSSAKTVKPRVVSLSRADLLKEKILEEEEKRQYSSEKFKKIEERVRASLKKQATDDVLKDITL